MLKVTAKDFGPIIDGTVELKPLTVFVGPSNTGKSYMATLIYALMQAKDRAPANTFHGHEMARWAIPGRHFVPIPEPLGVKNEEAQAAVYNWILENQQKDIDHSDILFRTLPMIVQDLAQQATRASMQTIADILSGELRRIHGELVEFTRLSDRKSQLGFEIKQVHPLLDMSLGVQEDQICEFGTLFDVSEATVSINSYLLEELQSEAANHEGVSQSWSMAATFMAMIVIDILGGLMGNFRGATFYLPAARSGIAQGYRIIASTLLRRYPTSGQRSSEIPSFSGVIADFMGHLLNMEHSVHDSLGSELEQTINFFEQEVTRGSIFLQESELPYPEIYYEPFSNVQNSRKFSLNQTSSMVSELAPVILFLKYLVRPGDLLILEEPESQLHPASQRQMARAIVRLVNAGVKVIITTHSDYFVSQLNNLMRISYASDRWLKGKGFERADCLKHAEVSAYAFRWDEKEGGSRVSELEIRNDVGIDEDEFALVANDLYEETINFQRIRVK
jgi:predicted ATPase